MISKIASTRERPSYIRAVVSAALLLMVLGGCRQTESSIAYLKTTDGYWEVWVAPASGGAGHQLTHMKADVARISWYSDGRALLVNLQDGRLFRVDADNGQSDAIQAPMQGILDAALSPDDQRIAFSLSTAGSIDNNDIWVFAITGGGREKLTSMPRLQHEPTWSRDGKFLYFLSGGGGQTHDIWRVDMATHATEQLTVNTAYHFDLALRRDGTVAYSGNKSGNYNLWLRYKDGRTEQLTDGPDLDARPSWSPTGKELAFESSRGGVLNIWRIDLKSHKLQQITHTKNGARQPAWSPARARQ